jgi:predicted ATP-dependent endonuclease of OLD family
MDFDSFNVLVGDNGSGKSAVLRTIRQLREFVVQGGDVMQVFPPLARTRWLTDPASTFELTFEVEGEDLTYRLEIEHGAGTLPSRVLFEQLDSKDGLLFDFSDGVVQLYNDDNSAGPQFPVKSERSALNFISETPNNQRLSAFKRILSSILVIEPVPYGINNLSDFESTEIYRDLSNFASWLRAQFQDTSFVVELQSVLEDVLPRFKSISLSDLGGGRRLLEVTLKTQHSQQTFAMMELSEGQQLTIALFALLTYVKRQKRILLLDEPDNFVSHFTALRLLRRLEHESYLEEEFQSILVTHHPSLIDEVNPDVIWLLSRRSSDHSIVRKFDAAGEGPISTLASRGWLE